MDDNGPHSIGFRATDKSGNTSDAVTIDFVVDINRAPTEPSLASPSDGTDVETATPALVISNASDPNGDALTYDFEVYEDGGLTKLVASAAGYGETTGGDIVDCSCYAHRKSDLLLARTGIRRQALRSVDEHRLLPGEHGQ